jgi:hypothetical protein
MAFMMFNMSRVPDLIVEDDCTPVKTARTTLWPSSPFRIPSQMMDPSAPYSELWEDIGCVPLTCTL